ncbi:methyltransferase domain-containing protein [Phenylobacterium sp.]|uniref:class I SAM-dependent methyltransferase n=1 Tax=Phenylobacterium sp. TaxID=1871053 RepID=UPI0039837B12
MPATIENVDTIAKPTGYEAGRQAFISTLRKSVLMDVGGDMKKTYLETVEPGLTKGGKAPNGRQVKAAMENKRIYRFFTALRINAQEMVFESVRPQLERNAGKLISAAAAARAKNPAGGTLELNPDLATPRYVSEVDVHLMPGCFHSEHAPDDVLQGARNTYGTVVFGGALSGYRKGGPGSTIAHFLKERYPDFQPQVIVDLACTAGSNTFPYKDVFPDAEVHGVDVAAPCLRYGHARAEATGRKIHFHQQSADKLDFPDNSVDFITSSFFLHEIPVKVTKAVIAECYRVLKPGGLMIHFELPPGSEVEPYHDFFLDWDTWHNNEPSYQHFRAQVPRDLVLGAGFKEENYIQNQLLNMGSVSDAEFRANALGEVKPKPGFGGVSWFTFGAWK